MFGNPSQNAFFSSAFFFVLTWFPWSFDFFSAKKQNQITKGDFVFHEKKGSRKRKTSRNPSQNENRRKSTSGFVTAVSPKPMRSAQSSSNILLNIHYIHNWCNLCTNKIMCRKTVTVSAVKMITFFIESKLQQIQVKTDHESIFDRISIFSNCEDPNL